MTRRRLFGGPPRGEAEMRIGAVLERLDEGAAVCDRLGRVLICNRAWRERVGERPGPLRCADGLFTAFLHAGRHGAADGVLRLAGAPCPVRVATLGEDFLLRLTPCLQAADPPRPNPATMQGAPMPGFTAASPFGAALIEAGDPFAGAILEANATLAALAQAPVEPGTSLGALMTPASRADAAAHHAAGGPGPIEVVFRATPHCTAHLYLVASGERTSAYLLDVTEQKSLQAQLAQRNKMEAIGQLAGGVAHDFNNLLTAMRLRADELLLRHTLGDPSHDSLGEIRDTVLRAADLVRQLLTFSRKATLQRQIVDLGESLMNFEVLLRRLLREDVRLETDYGRDTPCVRIDKAQLENAVMNLVVNARDALKPSGGGVITLRCAGLEAEAARALGYTGPPDRALAMIEVADTGPGLAPEVLQHLFEPFFTTKAVGDGTGLGLATVYGVVEQAGGWLAARSPPGGGAVFRLFLPAVVPGLTLEAPEAGDVRAPARDLSGVGRILLVEDEVLVRGITARLLRARGYEVVEAADGQAALEAARAFTGRIDLMICDVVMPGMDGPTLLKAARADLAAAPVIFISGYAEAEFSDLLEGEPNVSFLAKPLDILSLAEHVKQRLNDR